MENNAAVPLTEIMDTLNENCWSVLKLIQENPYSSLREIRTTINFSQEKCYKILSQLEGGVLIKTNRGLSDGRVNGYSITEYGTLALSLYEKNVNKQ